MEKEKERYQQILQPIRMRKSSVPKRNKSDEFYSDQSRIIYCSSFRRLQQKAQVFSLEPNSSVRTRLIHSLEVADLGQSLAIRICEMLKGKDIIGHQEAECVPIIVKNACLVHDLGNPPFGHFGEAAIKEWTQTELANYAAKSGVGPTSVNRFISDFKEFDGNPQGLRVLTRLHCETDEFGLNLTYPTLLSTIKYPCSPGATKDDGLHKKIGYFFTEEDRIKDICDQLSWDVTKKYPLAYIMEAADDIAYCLSDISDGIEKGILTIDDFWNDLETTWKDEKHEGPLPLASPTGKEKEYFNLLSVKWSKVFCEAAVKIFVDNHQAFLEGTKANLFENTIEGSCLETIKTVSRRRLYRSIEAESIELSGYSVISGLLKHFGKLLLLNKDDFLCFVKKGIPPKPSDKKYDLEWRIFNRLSKRLIQNYNYQLNEIDSYSLRKSISPDDAEWWLRAHLIVDHISGMTDAFALQTYQMFEGMIRF